MDFYRKVENYYLLNPGLIITHHDKTFPHLKHMTREWKKQHFMNYLKKTKGKF